MQTEQEVRKLRIGFKVASAGNSSANGTLLPSRLQKPDHRIFWQADMMAWL